MITRARTVLGLEGAEKRYKSRVLRGGGGGGRGVGGGPEGPVRVGLSARDDESVCGMLSEHGGVKNKIKYE